MKISGSEKLILTMLCEIYEKFGIKGEIDPAFVKSAILNEQPWAFEWKYQGLLGASEQPAPPIVREVIDILDMWSFLEGSFERLDAEEKERVVDAPELYGAPVIFPGFDANNEEHYGVATFMIDDLERFGSFAGRDINSHSPSIDGYRRMFAVFGPMRASLTSGRMSPDQIIQVLKARHV